MENKIIDFGSEVKNTFCTMKDFIKDYNHQTADSVQEKLVITMHKYLPEHSEDVIRGYSKEIVDTLTLAESKRNDLNEKVKQGKSREQWFYETTKSAASYMTGQQSTQYLGEIDSAIKNANESFAKAMLRNDGGINGNPNLDGIIAEHFHKNTYNINAAVKGTNSKAEIPKASEHGYGKNSVDVKIGKTHYQMKYGKNANETIKMIKEGNYSGQVLIVPADQVEEVQKAFPNRRVQSILDQDGATSNELTKAQAKKLQQEVQDGNFENVFDWNVIKNKDIVRGIGKNAGKAGLMGFAMSAGFEIINQVRSDEDADLSEIVKKGIEGGADFGLKTAISGAVKVASEKGILSIIPKGTPAANIANVVHIAVENVKTIAKCVSGKISITEAKDEIANTTISTTAAIATSTGIGKVGAAIGSVIGPVGSVVGGVVGGFVGYAIGSSLGSKIYEKGKEIARNVKSFMNEKILKKTPAIINKRKAKA